jgi:prepilin-type N-terminal cleavage/methylation domain-containing protein
MKNTRNAFTLIELLVVIAIIAILAAMSMAAIALVRRDAQIKKARLEMSALVTAIEAYDSAYGRFPVSASAQTAAGANPNNGDFTYGATLPTPSGGTATVGTAVPYGGNSVSNNSEVIAILMDFTNYPGTGLPTINLGHVKNTQQTKFLNATFVSDPTWPGVGPDLVYRDPWGNPYIITLDLNGDGQCNDTFYELQKVSQNSGKVGFYGLFNNVDAGGNGPHFQFHGQVMVWSVGPKVGSLQGVDTNSPANAGANKNHVLSWQ